MDTTEIRTELIFIIDKSGSMEELESDTVGGFNATLARQKEIPGACRLTTLLFDTRVETLHDRIDLPAVAPMREKDYRPGGGTALLDAIGVGIEKIHRVQKLTVPKYRAQKILCCIITDGYENSSRRYTLPRVKKMIEGAKRHGWEFLFLGANIDAVEAAESIGISEEWAAEYRPTNHGTRRAHEAMCEMAECVRAPGEPPQNWKRKLEESAVEPVPSKPQSEKI